MENLKFIPETPHILEPLVEERRIGLPMALGIAISIALAFTFISLLLYISGPSRLDLSKPGLEAARPEVVNDSASTSFDTSSPITSKSIDTVINQIHSQQKELSNYGRFDSTVLDDSSLGLSDTPVAQ